MPLNAGTLAAGVTDVDDACAAARSRAGARGAVAFERIQPCLLRGACDFQCDLFGLDADFHRGKHLQLCRQLIDPARALALQVTVVGEQALAVGDPVLREQQLERRILAERMCGAQQRGQRPALARQAFVEFVAADMQVRERRRALVDLALQGREFACGVADLLVRLSQRPCRGAALALQLAALRGDRREVGARAFEPALRFVLVLRGGRHRRAQHKDAGQQRGQAPKSHQPCVSSNRLRPVIASGRGSPSRSSMVGATSRNALPARKVARRVPT